ncbi:MAG: hypothetical protein KatS3mg118_1364 [Paracoccaceae bacterium]|nr:MAG: hypothetical protein D6686_11925 [Alphaproteobacteria bacterium]GIX13405.1 MAG: hypothetical protein KatS3mg118_1364 [Paracoccaceae bacterium]
MERVAASFRSTYHHKVDGKGRVSVPAAFRRTLEQGDPDWSEEARVQPRAILLLGAGEHPCIEVYTVAGMAALEDRARASGDYDVIEAFAEEVVANSLEVRLDDAGRLLLGRELRDRLGITDEAVFVGKLDRFEIWEPRARAAFRAAFEADEGAQARRREMMRRLMRVPLSGGGGGQ